MKNFFEILAWFLEVKNLGKKCAPPPPPSGPYRPSEKKAAFFFFKNAISSVNSKKKKCKNCDFFFRQIFFFSRPLCTSVKKFSIFPKFSKIFKNLENRFFENVKKRGSKMGSFFDQKMIKILIKILTIFFHENRGFSAVSLKSKIYGRKVEIFWKLPSFNKIYSDFIKFLLKIYGTNYEIYCVIKGSFWGPQDPLDPPRTPLGPRKRAVYGTNPRFYPIFDPWGPLLDPWFWGSQTPKKRDLRNKPSILPHFGPWGPPDPDLDFLEKWGVETPKNEVKSDISGTKHYFWWRFPDFGPLMDPSGPLKSWKISKNRHFLDPPKKWGVSTWFFSKMNELVCVNREAENLLSRIPIRDSTFFDEFFVIF